MLELLKATLAVFLGISYASQAGSPNSTSDQPEVLRDGRTREEVISEINRYVEDGDTDRFVFLHEWYYPPVRNCPSREAVDIAFERGHWDTLGWVFSKCPESHPSQKVIDREFLNPESKLRKCPSIRIACSHCPSKEAVRQAHWNWDWKALKHKKQYCGGQDHHKQ